MEQVEKDQAAAAEVQAVTAVEEQKAQAASAEATGIKDSVQKDLDEVSITLFLNRYLNVVVNNS